MRVGVGAGLLAVALLAGGCAGTPVSLDSRPTDEDSARDLARTVAGRAHCAGFEDYRLDGTTWQFTCQIGASGERMFGIRITNSATAQARAARRLAERSTPYRAGRYFLVTEFLAPGRTTTPAHLTPFPGRLVTS